MLYLQLFVLFSVTGNRVEDYLFEKIEKKKPNRLSNIEYLGLDMIEAGNEFGPGTAYGMLALKCGYEVVVHCKIFLLWSQKLFCCKVKVYLSLKIILV